MDIKIEKKLWDAVDELCGSLSAEECMHVILGIFSLKYISDKYDFALSKITDDDFKVDELNSRMFHSNYDAFKVPEEAHWKNIMNFASSSEIGQKIDEAFYKLEVANPMLKGIFKREYNDKNMDQNKLGEVVKIFSNENFTSTKEDIIGKFYKFLLGKFFKKRGQKGAEFYTPASMVNLMVNLIKPFKGFVYDPACGTGGIFVQTKKYIEEHGGNIDNITIYGQESNNIRWKLGKLNLILNSFSLNDMDENGVLGNYAADTFTDDQHKDKKFDFIMTNPPFGRNKKWNYKSLKNDSRWKWGIPLENNPNYAWLSHIVSKLSINGKAATISSIGSLTTSNKKECAIREKLIKDNKIDAIITLPKKLFHTTPISSCLWVFNQKKKNKNILMICGSELEGLNLSTTLIKLTDENIKQITGLYDKHLKGEEVDEKKFAKTISIQQLQENNFLLEPRMYINYLKEKKIDKKLVKEEIKKLSSEIQNLMNEFTNLKNKVNKTIKKSLNFDEKKEE